MKIANIPYECYGLHEHYILIEPHEVFELRLEDVSVLQRIGNHIKVIFTVSDNLSSHFFNVLRFFCDSNKFILLIGDECLLKYIEESKTFQLSTHEIVLKNSYSCIVIKRKASSSKCSDIIELNCLSLGICHRPQKSYSEKLGKIIAESQTSDDMKVKFEDGKLWNYYGRPFREWVKEYLSGDCIKYSQIMQLYLQVLKEIFSSTDICGCAKDKYVRNLYKYSPYVGYFLNVVSNIVYSKSEVSYNNITLAASKVYNLNMDDFAALRAIDHLSRLLCSSVECHALIQSIVSCRIVSNYEVFLYVISIVSDIRRRANLLLRNGR